MASGLLVNSIVTLKLVIIGPVGFVVSHEIYLAFTPLSGIKQGYLADLSGVTKNTLF